MIFKKKKTKDDIQREARSDRDIAPILKLEGIPFPKETQDLYEDLYIKTSAGCRQFEAIHGEGSISFEIYLVDYTEETGEDKYMLFASVGTADAPQQSAHQLVQKFHDETGHKVNALHRVNDDGEVVSIYVNSEYLENEIRKIMP